VAWCHGAWCWWVPEWFGLPLHVGWWPGAVVHGAGGCLGGLDFGAWRRSFIFMGDWESCLSLLGASKLYLLIVIFEV